MLDSPNMRRAGRLRSVAALAMPGLAPNALAVDRPDIRWVDPRTLMIEGDYQRDLSRKSLELIGRMVTGWDWAAMKPPICAETADGVLVIIDGQHTAIGAASHPAVAEIPVMVVRVPEIEHRAGAFVRHNSDRVGITLMQVHYASLAAGDEVAVAVDQACAKAGATILRSMPNTNSYAVGHTVAVGTIRKITERRGLAFMARVLRILVEAKRAPLSAPEIQAVTDLLTEPEWRNSITGEDLSVVIRSKSIDDWQGWAESKVRKGLKMPRSRALAIAWWQNTPKKRRAA